MALVHLRDFRAQALFNCSDFATLSIAMRRYPTLLSESEVHAILSVLALPDGAGIPWAGRREDVDHEFAIATQAGRWVLMASLIEGHPRVIMDIGAYMGAHAVALSNRFGPDTQVIIREQEVGMEPAIRMMIDRYADYPESVEVSIGSGADTDREDIDCVVLGEILEHQTAPYAFLHAVEAMCTEDAQIILSTPLGPWEQYEPQHCHVWHWEPEDYGDLARHRPAFERIVTSQIPVPQVANEAIPAFVQTQPWRHGHRANAIVRWRVVREAEPLGRVVWDRKLADWGL